MKESQIKKLDVSKFEIKSREEDKEINECEFMLENGEFSISGYLNEWTNVLELELDHSFKHRYFLVWKDGEKPFVRRLEK